jgi:hypothetical protein
VYTNNIYINVNVEDEDYLEMKIVESKIHIKDGNGT